MDLSAYHFGHGGDTHAMSYLTRPVLRILKERGHSRILEIGCGNGAMARRLSAHGYNVTGIDPSAQGIEFAKAGSPGARFEIASAYDDLSRLGRFPIVLSLEVVEHCFYPRQYARTVFNAVEP